MKWSVILLLSTPTKLAGITCFQFTLLLIPIGGRSWLYKLLYKCMKCGYEKEQIWSEKLSWRMKLHRHINSDIQNRSKHYFQIKPPLDKGCHMRVVRKNTKTHTSGPDVALTAAPWNMFTRKYSSLFLYERGCEKCILLEVETFLGSALLF